MLGMRLVAGTELLPWFVERVRLHHRRRQRRRRHLHVYRKGSTRLFYHWLTVSIARSAKRQLFNLPRGRFWGFSPLRGDTLHRWGWNSVPSSVPNFTPIGATITVQDPQNWNFYWYLTKMWNIKAPQGRIPCAIFTKFAEFVPGCRIH